MKAILLLALALVSTTAFAGQTPGRQQLVCNGVKLNGIKQPVMVQVLVLNSKQVEGMKIRYKNQIWVNELNRVQGELYDDGIIKNHVMFTAKTDSDLAILLPVNFRMMKTTDAYLAKQVGDEISFTAMTCTLTNL
jgi:hypothetical protein